jgi:hypothetical protein
MEWIFELGKFLHSLIFSHWLPIVTTGAFSGLFEWYERHHETKIPSARYVRWVIVGGLAVSVFLTWQDEYRARINAEKDIAEKAGQISILRQDNGSLEKTLEDRYENYREVLAKQNRENEQLSLRNEALTKDVEAKAHRIDQLEGVKREKARRHAIRKELSKLQSETENLDKELTMFTMGVQPPLIAKIIAWESKMLVYISRELGEAEAGSFRMAEGDRALPTHIGSYLPQWREWWSRLGAKIAAIEKLKDRLGR